MPSINDIINKKTKKFEKKDYRPWDDDSIGGIQDEHPIREEEKQQEKVNPDVKLLKLDNSIIKENNIEKIKASNLATEERYIDDLDLDKFSRGLYGVQKFILLDLIENIDVIDEDNVYTRPVTTSELSVKLKVPQNSIATTLQRLKTIGILFTHEYKPGRGGYAVYRISKILYNHLRVIQENNSKVFT